MSTPPCFATGPWTLRENPAAERPDPPPGGPPRRDPHPPRKATPEGANHPKYLPEEGVDHQAGVGQVGEHGVGAERRQLLEGVAPSGDEQAAGAGGPGAAQVAGGVADDPHRRRVEAYTPVGPKARQGDGDQLV